MKIELIPDFNDFFSNKKIVEKSENQTYSYGCIMGYYDLNQDYYKAYLELDQNDIYNNDENEYGIEIEPHVTVLYGLHDTEIQTEQVIEFLKVIKPVMTSLYSISIFENENYDVLKFSVNSESLHIIHEITKKMFPYTSSYPDYIPHCTIAYLKPGTGKKYVKDLEQPIEIAIDKWVYSQSSGEKVSINRDGTITDLRNTEDIEMPDQTLMELYNGYEIRMKKHEKFNDSYYMTVYKDNIYKLGIRGIVEYRSGLDAIKSMIDNINE
jgi:2'-5' RNA ligase